jgi:hypothetical protein
LGRRTCAGTTAPCSCRRLSRRWGWCGWRSRQLGEKHTSEARCKCMVSFFVPCHGCVFISQCSTVLHSPKLGLGKGRKGSFDSLPKKASVGHRMYTWQTVVLWCSWVAWQFQNSICFHSSESRVDNGIRSQKKPLIWMSPG